MRILLSNGEEVHFLWGIFVSPDLNVVFLVYICNVQGLIDTLYGSILPGNGKLTA